MHDGFEIRLLQNGNREIGWLSLLSRWYAGPVIGEPSRCILRGTILGIGHSLTSLMNWRSWTVELYVREAAARSWSTTH